MYSSLFGYIFGPNGFNHNFFFQGSACFAPGWEPPLAVHRLRPLDHATSSADLVGPRSIDERTIYGCGLDSIRDNLDFNRTIIITHLDRGTNGLLTIRLTTTYYRY